MSTINCEVKTTLVIRSQAEALEVGKLFAEALAAGQTEFEITAPGLPSAMILPVQKYMEWVPGVDAAGTQIKGGDAPMGKNLPAFRLDAETVTGNGLSVTTCALSTKRYPEAPAGSKVIYVNYGKLSDARRFWKKETTYLGPDGAVIDPGKVGSVDAATWKACRTANAQASQEF